MIRAGELDRLVTIKRPQAGQPNAINEVIDGWTDVGPLWAKKTPVNDTERARASEQGAVVTDRFLIRWSSDVAALDPRWLLTFDGRTYDISGVKEIGRREGLEITAAARGETA